MTSFFDALTLFASVFVSLGIFLVLLAFIYKFEWKGGLKFEIRRCVKPSYTSLALGVCCLVIGCFHPSLGLASQERYIIQQQGPFPEFNWEGELSCDLDGRKVFINIFEASKTSLIGNYRDPVEWKDKIGRLKYVQQESDFSAKVVFWVSQDNKMTLRAVDANKVQGESHWQGIDYPMTCQKI